MPSTAMKIATDIYDKVNAPIPVANTSNTIEEEKDFIPAGTVNQIMVEETKEPMS